MSDAQLFRGFSEAEQEKLAEEAARRWDSETVRASNARWKKLPPRKKQRILDEGRAVYTDLAAVMDEGPSSPKVQVVIARWHKHLQYFWLPSDKQLLGLADLYNEDARFQANHEAMQRGLAAFMREAVQEYVRKRKEVLREAGFGVPPHCPDPTRIPRLESGALLVELPATTAVAIRARSRRS